MRNQLSRRAIPITIRLQRPLLDRACAACSQNHGTSLVRYLGEIARQLASEEIRKPYGPAIPEEANRIEFSDPDDYVVQKELAILLEEHADFYPQLTMRNLLHLMSFEPSQADRSMATLIGRIMRNLGYKKVRTRLASEPGEPAEYGWVYRKV